METSTIRSILTNKRRTKMSKFYKLNERGEPVPCKDIFEFSSFFENADRVVAKTVVGEAEVSTVFLGIDHNYGDGPPVLWETMIFGGPHDQMQRRYTSRQDAVHGHNAAVAVLEKELHRNNQQKENQE